MVFVKPPALEVGTTGEMYAGGVYTGGTAVEMYVVGLVLVSPPALEVGTFGGVYTGGKIIGVVGLVLINPPALEVGRLGGS